MAAEMAAYRGDLEWNGKLFNAITKHAKTLQDQIQTCMMRVDALGQQEQVREAVNLSVHLLCNLGVSFPKNVGFFQVVLHLVKVKRMLGKKTDEELMSLPPMSDKHKIAAMKLLLSLTHHTFLLQRLNLVAMSIFQMVQLSLKHGVHDLSASGFSSYGLILCSMGQMREDYRFGQLSLKLVKRFNDPKQGEAQVVCVTGKPLFMMS
jgi:predicted ATPase